MKRTDHWRAFGPRFFERHQGVLLFLLNAPVVRRIFRRIFRVHGGRSLVGSNRIARILPHAVFWGGGPRIHAEFRTHWKFSKRLYFALKPIWWAMHWWDAFFADRWVPALSFGFDTLTEWPDPNPEGDTVDGRVRRSGVDETWSTLRSGAGNSFDDDSALQFFCGYTCSTTTDQYERIQRSIFLFNTSAIGSGGTVNSATMSLYGHSSWTYSEGPIEDPAINIYTSTPASDTGLANSDYGQIATTPQCDTPIVRASFSTSAYNNFSLNSTGIGNVSLTGITKFGARSVDDVNNSQPTGWTSGDSSNIGGYFADQTGTSNDPKLYVDYTPAVGGGGQVIIISKRSAFWLAVLGLIGVNPEVSRRELFRPWRRRDE